MITFLQIQEFKFIVFGEANISEYLRISQVAEWTEVLELNVWSRRIQDGCSRCMLKQIVAAENENGLPVYAIRIFGSIENEAAVFTERDGDDAVLPAV